jgi:hexokinase
MLQFLQSIFAAAEAMLLYPSLVPVMSAAPRKSFRDVLRSNQPTLQRLGQEVAELLTAPIDPQCMLRMSAKLQRRYLEKLQASTECMLPSFNHTLPKGQEAGTYLAIDVGGSTLRVALVKLGGRSRGLEGLGVLQMSTSSIDDMVRRLPGLAFFDWIAAKIAIMLADCPTRNGRNAESLSVGLSWSFPVEQTSPQSGKIQGMGKGFSCAQSTVGQDLGELIVAAGRKQGLNLRIDALINDSCATLLSHAYLEPSTSMSLILGTGTNMAIHLPVSCLGASKLHGRNAEWLSQTQRVTINTEVSMFGKGILPRTRWDDLLNRNHAQPNFQPLEYMTAGRYLGEILRLVIAEAIETADLFGGHLPPSLQEPYSLDTALLASIEADNSPSLGTSGAYLQDALELDLAPSAAEMAFLRLVVESISRRAAAYIAVALHALLTVESEASTRVEPLKTTIACNGSVIDKYPGFRRKCQAYMADMIASDAGGRLQESEVVLQVADEAASLGAAVAVAVAESEQ